MPESKPRVPARPPLVIQGARVLRYALVPRSVKFSGRTNLYVDGVEVAAASRLVISESLREHEIWLNYCEKDWEPIGTKTFKTITAARANAEKNYPGIHRCWKSYSTSRAAAAAYERKQWAGFECSFCGAIPPDFNTLFDSSGARICDACVKNLYQELTESAG